MKIANNKQILKEYGEKPLDARKTALNNFFIV